MISRRSFLGGAGSVALATTAFPSSAARATSGIDWNQLRDNLQGQLVLPSDTDYGTAKQLDQIQFDDINPQAIAYCASTADVALCLKFAQDNGVPIAARSGGHSAGGYSTTMGLVIDVSRLNSITLGNGTATLGGGAQLVDVTSQLAPSGLTISGGFCPTIAVGGYLHGGGVGLLTRSIGIASDKVTAAQVVLASGKVVTASPRENHDLYWAIRGGGGGNFGIVTSYTITPTPVTQLAVGTLTWAYDEALDMLDGWSQWLPDAPRTIGGGITITLADAAPGNTPAASILLASVGTSAELDTEVERLIGLVGSAPAAKNVAAAPFQAVMMNFYGCGSSPVEQCHRVDATPEGQLPRPAFGVERGRLFSQAMPRDGWAKALAVFDTERIAGQNHQLQVTALGGAANDLPRTATAYVHRDSQFVVNFLASNFVAPVSDEAKAAAGRFADNGFAVLDPYSNHETYQNFIDPRLEDWRNSYYAENYPRLTLVKATYDPHNVFRFAQSVGS